jgi:hypothetical protein
MDNYFDFVLCTVEDSQKTYLFHAPAYSSLEKGDPVIVETVNGNKQGTVIGCMTLCKDEVDKIDFIMNATGASKDVKKVLSKIEFKSFKYKEETNNE